MANEFIARKGLIVSGSTIVTSAVTASFFKGDGSQLTNITATSASFASTASFVNILNQTVSASGNIEAGTNLRSNYSFGDEGGEINLARPQTNSSISGSIVIDVNGNRVRIFESISPNRGGYWDISTLTAGVGTNLAGGTGTVTSVTAGSGLTGGTITGAGTITVDTGSSHFITGSVNVLNLKNVISSSTQQVVSTYTNATDNRVLTSTGAGGINGESALTFDGAVLAVTTNNAKYFQGGDDAALWDVNVSNTVGIYGVQDSTVGAIKLGSSGQTIYSNTTGVGIGTITPGALLHVQGNISASSFTGSLLSTNGVVSSSVQIDHNTTTNYSANRHVDHTTVSITAGSGLSGGGDISATRTLAVDTASVHFISGSFTASNLRGVVSSSNQILYTGLLNIPVGIVSGAAQVTALLPSGSVSSSNVSSPSQGTVRLTINGVNADVNTGLQTTSSPSFVTITSTQATGTAPLTIASRTLVTNLNADLLDGLDSTVFASTGSNTLTGVQTISSTTNSTAFNNGALIVQGGVGIAKDVNISGSVTISGVLTVASMSTQYVTSSQLNVSDNKITVQSNDLVRFGGLSVYDSGSSNATASIYWDSLNHQFIYENLGGSSYNSAILIAGPVNTAALGNEVGLTTGRVPVASGGDHIDSRLASSSIRVDFPSRLTHVEAGLYITGSVTSSVGFSGSGANLTNVTAASVAYSNITSLPTLISSSGQVSYTGLSNIPTGILSGSTQFNALTGTSASFATTANNLNGGTANYIPFWSSTTTQGSSVIYQNGSSIGIGTTTPPSKLAIDGSVTISGSTGGNHGIVMNRSGWGTFFRLGAISSSGDDFWITNNWNPTSNTSDVAVAGYITLGTTNEIRSVINGTRMTTLTSTGLGIGTTTPSAKLDIRGTAYLQADTNPVNSVVFSLTNQTTISNNGCRISLDAYNIGAVSFGVPTDDGAFTIYTGGSERTRVTSTGNVGIGTASPGSLLHVQGAISGSSMTLTGTATVQTLVETSTLQLKTNIAPLSSTLSTINRLEPVNFNWVDSNEPDIGLIAEHVEQIYPELVRRDENGNLLGVKYSKLTVILLKALQEMSQKIDRLEQHTMYKSTN